MLLFIKDFVSFCAYEIYKNKLCRKHSIASSFHSCVYSKFCKNSNILINFRDGYVFFQVKIWMQPMYKAKKFEEKKFPDQKNIFQTICTVKNEKAKEKSARFPWTSIKSEKYAFGSRFTENEGKKNHFHTGSYTTKIWPEWKRESIRKASKSVSQFLKFNQRCNSSGSLIG